MINILIVDDENTSRMTIDSIFSKYGECLSFDTGSHAVEAYENFLKEDKVFDLVILDICLENESGVDVLKNIRDLEKNVETANNQQAIVFMATGNNDIEIVKECIQEGCNDYILKPIKAKVIAPKMEKYDFKPLA